LHLVIEKVGTDIEEQLKMGLGKKRPS